MSDRLVGTVRFPVVDFEEQRPVLVICAQMARGDRERRPRRVEVIHHDIGLMTLDPAAVVLCSTTDTIA